MAPLPPLRIQLRQRESGQKTSKPTWRTRLKNKDPERYEEIKERDKAYSRDRAATFTEEQKNHERSLTRERVKLWRLRKKEKEDADKAAGKKPKKPDEKETATKRKKWVEAKRDQRAKWSATKRREVNLQLRMKRRQDKEELQKLRKQKADDEKKRVREEKKKRKEEEREKKKEEEREKLREKERQEEARKRKAEEEQHTLRQQEEQLAKEQLSLETEALDTATSPNQSTPRSGAAKRKSLSRARKKISPNPKIFAETVCDLISQATPRKKKALKQKMFKVGKLQIDSLITGKVAETLKSGRRKRDKETRLVRRGLASTLQVLRETKALHKAQTFYTTPKLLKSLNKEDKYRNPFRIISSVKKLVRSFFETKAVQLPNKKDISRKTLEKTAVLPMPVSTLFADFKKAYPHTNIKSSSFFMLRPRHVKLMGKSNLRGCLCEYCTNLQLKITMVNKLCSKFKTNDSVIKDTFHLTKLSMCNKPEGQDYHDPDCYLRQCRHCGVKLIEKHLESLVGETGADTGTQWSQWETVKVDNKSKMILNNKEGTVHELISELYKEAEGHPLHLHNWQWQHKEYSRLINDPPPNTVIGVLDFAENYACLLQDEVQAAHWAHEQATVHPIVCTYQCKCHSRPVTHSMIYISNDRKHDYHAVNHFYSHCINHLSINHKLDIDVFMRFSDGCAAQYKSKGPFLDVIQSDIPTEHHFFGSRHGKGSSDGESAVVKQQASTAVRSGRAVIPTPHAMYTFVKETLSRGEDSCIPFRREFFYVPSTSIDRERPAPKKAINGTRKIHCLKKGKNPLTVVWKRLSCFCQPCLTNNGACINSRYTGAWTAATLVVPDVTPRRDPPPEKQTEMPVQDIAPEVHTAPHSNPSTEDQTDETITGEHTALQPALHPVVQDFVTVQLPVKGSKKRSQKLLVAKVASVEGSSVRLQYMEQTGELFKWPAGEPQYVLHPCDDIIKILPSPEPVRLGSRKLSFKFA